MAVWPVVQQRLVALLPTLAGWGTVTVYDGEPVTREYPPEYCTVGFADDEDGAGTFTTERALDGFMVQETGGVRCEIVVQTGDVDVPTVRARAFVLLAELEAALRVDQTLGVLAPASTTSLTTDVVSLQNSAGSAQRLPFTVEYLTRT